MMKKLMERVRMIRENQKKNGTKGFSMIELIIVIAIMAILIALIGTQLLPYLEKSRRTRDLDTLNAVLTATQTTMTDYELKPADVGTILTAADKKATFETYLGYAVADAPDKFKSEAASGGTIALSATPDGKSIKVTMGTLFVCSDGTSGVSTTSSGGTSGS